LYWSHGLNNLDWFHHNIYKRKKWRLDPRSKPR
jgi:hypothetical protein